MTYVNPYIKHMMTGIDTNLKILLNLPSPPDPNRVHPAQIPLNFDGIPIKRPSLMQLPSDPNSPLTLNTVPSDTDSFTTTHAIGDFLVGGLADGDWLAAATDRPTAPPAHY